MALFCLDLAITDGKVQRQNATDLQEIPAAGLLECWLSSVLAKEQQHSLRILQ